MPSYFETEFYHDLIDDEIDAEVDSFYDEYLTDEYVDENEYEELCNAAKARTPKNGRKRAFKSKKLKEREDPFEKDDLEFYKTHRFSKSSVRRLAKLLFPGEKKNNRGLPFDPEQVVCTALKHLGGVSFKHLYKKGTKATGMRHYYAFISAVNKLKDEYIKLPSVDEMALSIKSIWEKYHLLNFIGSLGSTQIDLPHKPRGLSDGDVMKNYKAKKTDATKNTRYALNINLASGPSNMIFYATVSPAGQPVPSWEEGEPKSYMESLAPPVHLLGEPDQSLSITICTPFSRWESTQATLILHNISVLWSDPLPPEIIASSPLLEPLHTVHEDIPQKYFTEKSIQVLELTTPVQVVHPTTQHQQHYQQQLQPRDYYLKEEQRDYYKKEEQRDYYQPPHNYSLQHGHQPQHPIHQPRPIYTTFPFPPSHQNVIQDLG